MPGYGDGVEGRGELTLWATVLTAPLFAICHLPFAIVPSVFKARLSFAGAAPDTTGDVTACGWTRNWQELGVLGQIDHVSPASEKASRPWRLSGTRFGGAWSRCPGGGSLDRRVVGRCGYFEGDQTASRTQRAVICCIGAAGSERAAISRPGGRV